MVVFVFDSSMLGIEEEEGGVESNCDYSDLEMHCSKIVENMNTQVVKPLSLANKIYRDSTEEASWYHFAALQDFVVFQVVWLLYVLQFREWNQ